MNLEKLMGYDFARDFVNGKFSEDNLLAKLIKMIKTDDTFRESTEIISLETRDLKKVVDALKKERHRKSRRRFTKLALIGAGTILAQQASKPVYDYFTRGSGESRVTPFRLTEKIRSMINNKYFPNMNNLIDPGLWASLISESYTIATGRDISNNSEYQDIILTLIYIETGFRTVKKLFSWLSIPKLFGTSEGAMQIKNNNLSYKSLKEVLTISIKHLEKIIGIYTMPEKINERSIHFIFTDWNAGAFSCRNAATQIMLNKRVVPSPNLVVDGDLGVLSKNALKRLNIQDRLGINENQIDMGKGSLERFYKSETYFFLSKRYPEINIPILVDARVQGLRRIRALISNETISSKQYAEESMRIYNIVRGL